MTLDVVLLIARWPYRDGHVLASHWPVNIGNKDDESISAPLSCQDLKGKHPWLHRFREYLPYHKSDIGYATYVPHFACANERGDLES